MIKIFQMGDMHLDSPLSGGDVLRSENGRKRLRSVFRRMMKYVRENACDLVLIPGDLYESGFLTEESAEMLKSEFASLPCPVVISPGNHDPYDRSSFYACADLPKNVYVFKSEKTERFDIEHLGVSIYGYAFSGISHRENPLDGVYAEGDGINILLAHSEVGSPLSPYAPMSYADMEASGFDYAALAHIHKAPQVYSSDLLTAAYSGMAQGRAFDEIGSGGALLVTVFETGDRKEIKYERISFSEYSFEVLLLNVTDFMSNDEIAELIKKEMRIHGYGEKNAVRVLLEGLLPVEFTPNLAYIKRKSEGAVDYLEIKDNTLPLADAGSLEKDITLRGELYRTLLPKLNSSDVRERSLAGMALKIGLTALDGGDLGIFLPTDESNEKEGGADE